MVVPESQIGFGVDSSWQPNQGKEGAYGTVIPYIQLQVQVQGSQIGAAC